jgi:hypothetical protein
MVSQRSCIVPSILSCFYLIIAWNVLIHLQCLQAMTVCRHLDSVYWGGFQLRFFFWLIELFIFKILIWFFFPVFLHLYWVIFLISYIVFFILFSFLIIFSWNSFRHLFMSFLILLISLIIILLNYLLRFHPLHYH